MAEALVVVSIVASIVQLVDFSTRVVARLDEFYSVAKEIPKSFRHIKTELPLLTTTLAQLKEAIDTTSVADASTKALVPVIAGCNEQVSQLDTILKKTLPESDDSLRTKGKKAIVSLQYDSKVESITKTLRNYVGILTFYYAAASSTLQPLTDTKLCKIRQWLSAPDPSTNYQKALKLRQADTGLWLLESDAYTGWKKVATTPLWLFGIPGCGKTILSSTVLQDVLQHCQDDPGKATAYFFFDFNDSQKQNPEMMVRSLMCQLSQQSFKIPASLDALYSSCESGQRQPSNDALMNALQSMIQDLPQVYIVLDALDECAQRVELIEILEMIVEWRIPTLHLLVTSRRERDIESSLEGFIYSQNRICLESAVVDKDIQRYVQQRLSNDKRLEKWKKDAFVMRQIETVLVSGAKGMFRWAVCQLDELGKCVNRKMLQKALASLPPNLDQTYDRILAAINEDYSQYALRILQWLTFSARPLSIDEVAEVVAIDTERDPAFDRDEVLQDPMEVLKICSSLVTVTFDTDNNDNRRRGLSRQIVALAHYSVKEYLVSDRIWTGNAARYGMREDVCHNAISTSCLGYLLQFQELELEPDFLESFKLAQYSAQFWIGHAKKTCERTKETNEAMICLCCEKTSAYVNWIRLWNPDLPWRAPVLQRNSKEIPNPLYYAALFGLRDVVELVLLNKGADVNVQGGEYGSALQAASARGHEAVVRLLLDNNADVNAQGRYYGNALQAASARGHEAVVKLLLDNNADVNAQGGEYGNALQVASAEGHEAVVKLLLDNNADVNAQGGEYSNALQAALAEGHEAVVKLLLDNNADVNAQGGYYGNALQAASARGHEAVVKLLLDNNADVNAQGGEYGNALQVASAEGHEAVVKLLLDNNADVNAQGGEYGNALQAALVEGHEAVVKLLLNNNADVNAQGGEYGNALQAASAKGHEAVVKLLLDNNADVNAQGGEYGNALQVASAKGHEAVVKLLLDNDANIALPDNYGYTPINIASSNHHFAVVRLLLERGAYTAARGADPRYDTIMNLFAFGGHLDLLCLAHEQFPADVYLSQKHGRTPLHSAARGGHLNTFQYLIKLGLDPASTDEKGDNALCYASSGGSLSIVDLILGKYPRPFDEHTHWDPLHWACRAGTAKVVEVLIKEGFRSRSVTIPGSEGQWSPLAIALFHGNGEMLERLSTSCKSHLGTESNTVQLRSERATGYWCNGCLHVIYGPRFHCRTCLHLDYCFMCKPFLGSLHENHEWDRFSAPG